MDCRPRDRFLTPTLDMANKRTNAIGQENPLFLLKIVMNTKSVECGFFSKN